MSVQFKSIKRKRPIRKTEHEDDESPDESEESNKNTLEETLELQRLRKRAHGVNAVTLACGKKVTKVDELVNNDPDPFKLKSGGLLTLDKAKQAADVEKEAEIGTQFSKETRIRDEDEEMKKFIETEMERRRGKHNDDEKNQHDQYLSPEDKALMSLPDHLKKSQSKKNEEMLSSQMLSGIPEVDLGIEEKIRNIEATEMAKKKLTKERTKSKNQKAEWVPVVTNLSVNFKEPNRFKTEMTATDEAAAKKGDKVVTTQRTVVVGQLPEERVIEEAGVDNDPTKATDDMHLTKFKKQFQRK